MSERFVHTRDPDFTLLCGDVRDVLPTLEPDSIDCAACSPPFYALRDYGVDGQIGLEATPDEWVAELVAVFREVRRVLKPTATLWVEVGDSYNASPGQRKASDKAGAKQMTNAGSVGGTGSVSIEGCKPKDLLGQPWMLAFALRADGWYLRQAIIWHKPNAMPESVRDRCTTAHSYVFLLSKQPRYWFDADAISEPAAWERWGDQSVPKYEGTETASGWMQPKTQWEIRKEFGEGSRRGFSQNDNVAQVGSPNATSKNARSVWTVPTQGFAEAHFATWPEALVERILKAGCPEWVCGTCGKARDRVVEAVPDGRKWTGQRADANDGMVRGYTPGVATTRETVGWSDCGHDNYQLGTVLDPFMGSGTTALVARRLGRRSVGVELNREYADMAARRLQQLSLLAEGAA